jgi:hypothetical protein
MPSIYGRHNGRQVFLDVSIIHRNDILQYDASNAAHLKTAKRYTALVDTGATVTMITPRVVREMNLLPVTKMQFHGISGIQFHNAYLFYVGFAGASVPLSSVQVPDPDPDATWIKIYLCTKLIQGGELPDNGRFDVLLGMDIISTGKLVLDGMLSTFSFTF